MPALQDYETLNAEIKKWIGKVISTARGANTALKQFKGGIKKKYGAPERVRLSFPRHYVFVEKGVGRGRGIGSGKATPKPAINPALEAHINELADIAAEGMADVAVKNLFIK